MIGYYFYGRDSIDAYKAYNRQYSKSDNDRYLSKMMYYTSCMEGSLENPPEKIYYFNFPSSKGRTAMVGRTTRNTSVSSPMSGERETTFVHEYLFSGEDREQLMRRPEELFCLKPFKTRVEDILEEDVSLTGNKTYRYVFNDNDQNVFLEQAPEARWSNSELLDYFHIDRPALEELFYTFLDNSRKVCILLPQIDREGTDHALALMRALFAFLPGALAEFAGFLTYADAYEDKFQEHRIPYEIRYIFITGTEKNRQDAEKFGKQYWFFYPDRPSGVIVPEELRPLTAGMADMFLGGSRNQKVQNFCDGLDVYLNGNAGVMPSVEEFAMLYRFCLNYAGLLEAAEIADAQDESQEGACWQTDTPDEDLGSMLHILLERPADGVCKWQPSLENDIGQFVELCLRHDCLSEASYPMVCEMYGRLEPLKGLIVEYFMNRITDVQMLDYFSGTLPQGELRNKVLEGIYRSRSHYQVVLSYEFGRMKKLFVPNADTYEKSTGSVVKLLEEIRAKNPGLPSEPGSVNRVMQLLEPRYTADILTYAGKKEELMHFADDLKRIGVFTAYKESLVALSEKTLASALQKPGAISSLSKAELSVLQSWPQELIPRNSVLNRLEERLRAEVDIKGLADSIEKSEMPALISTLRGFRKNPAGGLERHPDAPDIVRRILKKAKNYYKVKGKQKEKEDNFDKLNRELTLLFPSYMDLIFANEMESPLGGILGLVSLEYALGQFGRQLDMEIVHSQMARAICEYFDTYEMQKADRKAIRKNGRFLEMLGISPKDLIDR